MRFTYSLILFLLMSFILFSQDKTDSYFDFLIDAELQFFKKNYFEASYLINKSLAVNETSNGFYLASKLKYELHQCDTATTLINKALHLDSSNIFFWRLKLKILFCNRSKSDFIFFLKKFSSTSFFNSDDFYLSVLYLDSLKAFDFKHIFLKQNLQNFSLSEYQYYFLSYSAYSFYDTLSAHYIIKTAFNHFPDFTYFSLLSHQFNDKFFLTYLFSKSSRLYKLNEFLEDYNVDSNSYDSIILYIKYLSGSDLNLFFSLNRNFFTYNNLKGRFYQFANDLDFNLLSDSLKLFFIKKAFDANDIYIAFKWFKIVDFNKLPPVLIDNYLFYLSFFDFKSFYLYAHKFLSIYPIQPEPYLFLGYYYIDSNKDSSLYYLNNAYYLSLDDSVLLSTISSLRFMLSLSDDSIKTNLNSLSFAYLSDNLFFKFLFLHFYSLFPTIKLSYNREVTNRSFIYFLTDKQKLEFYIKKTNFRDMLSLLFYKLLFSSINDDFNILVSKKLIYYEKEFGFSFNHNNAG